MVRDGLVFKDEDGQVIFNQHSFCELVKRLLVELVQGDAALLYEMT